MRLISCGTCGVVLDTDRILEPSIYDHDSGEVIKGNAAWDGDTYLPVITCPCCKYKIFYEDGEEA